MTRLSLLSSEKSSIHGRRSGQDKGKDGLSHPVTVNDTIRGSETRYDWREPEKEERVDFF
jgi:hypothetical protein